MADKARLAKVLAELYELFDDLLEKEEGGLPFSKTLRVTADYIGEIEEVFYPLTEAEKKELREKGLVY